MPHIDSPDLRARLERWAHSIAWTRATNGRTLKDDLDNWLEGRAISQVESRLDSGTLNLGVALTLPNQSQYHEHARSFGVIWDMSPRLGPALRRERIDDFVTRFLAGLGRCCRELLILDEQYGPATERLDEVVLDPEGINFDDFVVDDDDASLDADLTALLNGGLPLNSTPVPIQNLAERAMVNQLPLQRVMQGFLQDLQEGDPDAYQKALERGKEDLHKDLGPAVLRVLVDRWVDRTGRSELEGDVSPIGNTDEFRVSLREGTHEEAFVVGGIPYAGDEQWYRQNLDHLLKQSLVRLQRSIEGVGDFWSALEAD